MDDSPVAGEYPSPHLDMILETDKVVGSLVKMIEGRQLEEDTIIIFTSDNGGLNPILTPGTVEAGHLSNGNLRGMKGSIYEGGHRVPMIWRQDGVLPAGEKRDHLLGLNDIFATLCEIAGVEIPENSAMDSVSFADYLLSSNSTTDLRSTLGHWEYNMMTNEIAADSLRMGDLKVIRDFVNNTIELYDLSNDLYESNDMSSLYSYKFQLRTMLSELEEIGPCPADKRGKFKLRNGKRKNCKWFGKRKNRCKRFASDGLMRCPSTCSRHPKTCNQMRSNN